MASGFCEPLPASVSVLAYTCFPVTHCAPIEGHDAVQLDPPELELVDLCFADREVSLRQYQLQESDHLSPIRFESEDDVANPVTEQRPIVDKKHAKSNLSLSISSAPKAQMHAPAAWDFFDGESVKAEEVDEDALGDGDWDSGSKEKKDKKGKKKGKKGASVTALEEHQESGEEEMEESDNSMADFLEDGDVNRAVLPRRFKSVVRECFRI